MKAVFLDYATMGPGLDLDTMRARFPDLQVFDSTGPGQVADRIGDAEFVFANKVRLTDELFQNNPQLRFIGLTATGTDNVDLEAAKRYDVAVCNIRGYCTQSVAEHVFGCILNLAHNLQPYTATVAAGEWQQANDFCLLKYPLRELSSMTLGIVGYGELGKGVARIADAFSMTVLISARPGAKTVPDDRVSFGDLLKRADVISLHCPLNDDTRDMFGNDQFSDMRPDSILINTARGGLVNSAALVNALQTGEIAGAAIDVLPQEPPVTGDPLLDYDGPNLMMTPHIAWATDRARQAAIDELLANAASFLDGGRRNRVA